MPSGFWRLCRLLLLLPTLAAATAANAQTAANTPNSELPRFLVYFDEFSANLSDEPRPSSPMRPSARDPGVKAINRQARASSTGTAETNKYLAQTRSSIATDQLEADGIARTMVRQSRSVRPDQTIPPSTTAGSTSFCSADRAKSGGGRS